MEWPKGSGFIWQASPYPWTEREPVHTPMTNKSCVQGCSEENVSDWQWDKIKLDGVRELKEGGE